MEELKLNEAELMKAEKTALVVIDLQKGIANRQSAPYTGEQVVQNARRLVNAFMENGAFVVLVRVSSIDGKDMLKPRT
ncbi:MAG: isochorismatase family protein, partial [Bacillota bacterium]|nr:isochorismatase family protein [Bacillota bacterium]